MEEVQKAIDGRKPDFKVRANPNPYTALYLPLVTPPSPDLQAYVEPQKEKADIIIQVRRE